MKRPLFSCVVPVKGSRPYFDAAIESLRMQGMGDDLEVIVQDADVEPDEGQSDALNKGFAKARGEWLFWLNADDVLLPGTLSSVRDFIESSNCVSDIRLCWLSGNMMYLDKAGRVVRCTRERGVERCYKELPVRVFGPSSFFRRELLDRSGPFDKSLHYCMDTDLWCRFRELGYWYGKVPGYHWGFRVHEASKTSGVLQGRMVDRMRDEIVTLNARYRLKPSRLRTLRLRIARLLDGSTLRAILDTFRFRGKNWKDVNK